MNLLSIAGKKILPATLLCGALVLWFVLPMAGCSKITQENYSRIKVGMEYAEVVAIVGKPANCSSVFNATTCTWGNERRSIDISFIADKVVFLAGQGL